MCHQIFMLFYKTYSFSTEWAEYQDFPIFFVSYEEIEIFAKQLLAYSNSKIILFALSTTDASREAR